MLEYNNYRAPLGPILAPVPKCLDLREVACSLLHSSPPATSIPTAAARQIW